MVALIGLSSYHIVTDLQFINAALGKSGLESNMYVCLFHMEHVPCGTFPSTQKKSPLPGER
jgi:hypothetical protein